MEETELEDLDLEQRLDLEYHLYCLLHYNDTQICETMTHDADNNITSGRVVLHTPSQKENTQHKMPSTGEHFIEQTILEKNIIDKIDTSKYDIVMSNTLSSDVISIDSSDSEADVIEIIPPAPPVICIESDESDIDQNDESTYCIDMKSSNHIKLSLENRQMKEFTTTPITPTKTYPIVNCLTEKPPQCSSPMSVISDDFIQKDYESLNITDTSNISFMFKTFDNSTSTNVPNSVLDSDTNSDCSELPVNHQIFVHSDKRITAQNNASSELHQKNELRNDDTFKIPSDKPATLNMSEKDNSDLNYSYNEGHHSTPLKAHNKNSRNSLKKIANLQAKKRNTLNQTNSSKNNMIDKIAHLSMDEFYFKSWNGETFDHDKIISNMSRNKDDWKISTLDKSRYQKPRGWRPIRCRNCKQMGHAAVQCVEPKRIIKCNTCGMEGHLEPRCPNSICLRCGSPSSSYIIGCNNCNSSRNNICQLCKMAGHHQNYCPDLWRRYHKSIDGSKHPMESHTALKSPRNLFCSNCSSRGHLYHNCQKLRITEHTMTIPNILAYTPVYPIEFTNLQNDSSNNSLNETINDVDLSNTSDAKRTGKRKINYLPHPTKQSKKHDSNAFLNNLNDFEGVRSDESCVLTSTHMDEISSDVNVQNMDKFNDSRTRDESFNNDNNLTQDNSVTSSDNKITSGRLMLHKETLSALMNRGGTKFISETSKIMNISVQIKFMSNVGFLSLIGTKTQQDNFQQCLKNWIKTYNLRLLKLTGGHNLPRKPERLSKFLQDEFRTLSKDITNTLQAYRTIKAIENSINIVSHKEIKLYRRNLKRLNMSLFGKFGYRDGALHRDKLALNLQELEHLIPTVDTTPPDLYNDIRSHHDYIFAPIYHGNYEPLLDLYKAEKVRQAKIDRDNQIKAAFEKASVETATSTIHTNSDINQIQSKASTFGVKNKCSNKFQQDTNKILMQAEYAIRQARCNTGFRKKLRIQLELFSKKAKQGIFGIDDMHEMRKFMYEIEKKIY